MFVLRFLEKFSAYLERVVKASLILSMTAIIVFVNLAVFFRYVISAPLTWTTELSSYLLVYTVLFGAAIALRHNQFVKVEALLNLLPKHLKVLLVILTRVMIALFLVVCIGSPSMLIKKAIITNTVSPALGIPMADLYRLLRMGFIAMLFFDFMSTIEFIRTTLISDREQEQTK